MSETPVIPVQKDGLSIYIVDKYTNSTNFDRTERNFHATLLWIIIIFL